MIRILALSGGGGSDFPPPLFPPQLDYASAGLAFAVEGEQHRRNIALKTFSFYSVVHVNPSFFAAAASQITYTFLVGWGKGEKGLGVLPAAMAKQK